MSRRPNFLFVMADQLRADYLGCAGHPAIRTPNIDALAARGVRFSRAFVQAPVCVGSRMSFYTGRYAFSHGAHYNSYPLRLDEWTIGDALRPLGLTNGQFSLMMSLNRPNPPSIRAVSTLLAMDRTTLTANLKPLERRGLVTVAVDESDRRGRLLALTDAGRDLLIEAMPFWEKTHAELEALITASDPDTLRANLRALS